MVELLRADASFAVEWPDLGYAERTWVFDEGHTPGALVPFALDLYERWSVAAFSLPSIAVNLHLFSDFSAARFPLPPRDLRDRDPAELWHERYRPETEAAVAAIVAFDTEALDTGELASAIPALVQRSIDGFVATFQVLALLNLRQDGLVEFCERHLGGDAGVQTAHTMLQGRGTETTDMALRLEELALIAAEAPPLLQQLAEGGRLPADCGERYPQFAASFMRFLDRYGWRASTWTELHVPTWAEDAAVPIAMIVRYARDESTRPSRAQRRAADQREAAIADARARLPGDAERAELDPLLEVAAPFAEVRESRAHWQLLCSGALRGPLLALGRRLVAAGALADPEDVLLFYIDEFAEVAANPGADRHALARERRADLERCRRLVPPRYLGARPPASVRGGQSGSATRLERDSAGSLVVSGIPASRGVAHGRARVITDLADAGRLQSGEVLITRTTAPPWTPLFSIASAVVTNGGGALSHSAIVAREYGIPCVVGTHLATEVIADGAMLTVDGTRGTVTIDR